MAPERSKIRSEETRQTHAHHMQLSSSTPATGDRAKDVEHFDDILRTFIHETNKVREPRRQHQRRGENDGCREDGAGELSERQFSSHHNDVRRGDRRLEEHHSWTSAKGRLTNACTNLPKTRAFVLKRLSKSVEPNRRTVWPSDTPVLPRRIYIDSDS